MVTLVVTFVVVAVSIAGVLATTGLVYDQSATAGSAGPHGPRGVAVRVRRLWAHAADVPAAASAIVDEADGRRVRSAFVLALLVAVLGLLLAVALSGLLTVAVRALRALAGPA